MQILSNPEAATFLAAIRSEDADDTTRLVFADFLEEQNEAHLIGWAHFIRTQVKMATLWPYPLPPKSMDFIEPRYRKEYWLLEQNEIALLNAHQHEWLGYAKRSSSQHLCPGNPNRVKWRRGFPGLWVSDTKELRKYQSRASWPLFTSLTLQNARGGRTTTSNDQSVVTNIVTSDRLNEVVFGVSCSTNVRDWLGAIKEPAPNLRRIGFEMYDLLDPWMAGLTRPEFFRANKQAKLVLKPLNTFSTAAINNLKQVFGDRVAVDTSKCSGGAHGARRW